jgi:hypothetical protein
MCNKYVLHHFPAICKAGGKKILEIIQIRCRECSNIFYVCRKCYRRQAYCCQTCQIKGYKKRRQEARKRYRNKDEKKIMRYQAERMRKYRKWLENEKGKDDQSKNEEKVDDTNKTDGVENSVKSSLKTQAFVRKDKGAVKKKQVKRVVGEKGFCSCCGSEGVIVKNFLRSTFTSAWQGRGGARN